MSYFITFIFRLILNYFSGVLLIIIIVLPLYIKSLPDLDIWHTQILESEFTKETNITSFKGYLDLEQKLFAELEEKIDSKLPISQQTRLNRFQKDSLSTPESFDVNWNRSFVLPAKSPKAGVLLLHGLSDSPYSLRNIGQHLNKKGALVLGLRLPGHGTAPSGLLDIEWEDMALAVRLAMKYLADKTPGKPLYIIGYSTGAALGLFYSLSLPDHPSSEQLSGLILISPAIGVSKMAALARFKNRLSHIPGFKKMAWTGIIPEYNPFKYNSFTTNAGDQVYRLTHKINTLLISAKKNGSLKHLPDILAFQSIVDATVSTSALVDGLFSKLTKSEHELVIFDINRSFDLKPLIKKDPVPTVHNLLKQTDNNFTISFITNKSKGDRHVFLHEKKAGDLIKTTSPLNLIWPTGLYSLSHVALPFPKDDPLYGINDSQENTHLNLGDIPLKGEKGLLKIPPSEILRLKWNPFYPYMEKKIVNMIFP